MMECYLHVGMLSPCCLHVDWANRRTDRHTVRACPYVCPYVCLCVRKERVDERAAWERGEKAGEGELYFH